MKKYRMTLSLVALLFVALASSAQTAREVLDKAAAAVSVKEGITATFTMKSAQFGNASGSIAVKGRMFHAVTSDAQIWFDGTTQWTYLKRNDEVSVTTPTEAQLQTINPYTFISMYRKGYTYSMTQNSASFIVHLVATDQNSRVKEMFITVNKKNYHPTELKLLQGRKWTEFSVGSITRKSLPDSEFRFSQSLLPSAEVIDLR